MFAINNQTIFLRGKHDACVFPLTAHTAMDTATWRHYFRVAKSYGINHYRFHSWCPPQACFEAADIEGIYLQPELPFWGSIEKSDTLLHHFLLKEGLQIQRAYSNFASFVLFANGNELSGDHSVIADLTNSFRREEDRHLFALGSNNYLGFQGPKPEEDYYTTCRVTAEAPEQFNTHVRASFSFADALDGGYLNHTYPNTTMNFDSGVALSNIPVISHETGQYQIYPNYNEINKYTGVLQARNMQVFQQRLRKAGMIAQANDFFMASGKWAALLYKAEIEMDLRTAGLAGFQLLDLQDYPGQGSAYVGILDAFMDSKGLITPNQWHSFCSPIVPLMETSKLTYYNNDTLQAVIKLANYSNAAITNGRLLWSLKNKNSWCSKAS